MPRAVRILLACLVGLILAAGIAWYSVERELRDRQAAREGQGAGGAGIAIPNGVTIGGAFTLVDSTGRTVTEADFAGAYRLVFFGYTYCPDICPTELQVMAAALDELGPDAAQVRPLFVTIDPERDTPQQVGEYVALFDDRITGLTGTPEQVAAIARAYRVYYAKAPGGDEESYLMDHSTYVYLMGPAGELLTVFPRGTAPAEMADAVAKFMSTRG